VLEAADAPGGQVRLAARTPARAEMMGLIDWRVVQCEASGVEIRCNTYAEAGDVTALDPDVVIVATGGIAQTRLYERDEELDHAVSSWDVLSGDVRPAGDVLIFDEAGDHAGLQAAQAALEAGARVELMTPDRSIAPEVMGMNLSRYLKTLQRDDMRFTVGQRLLGVERAGNRLRAAIGTDYSERVTHAEYDQVVLNYGTAPLDELYFELKPLSRNRGEVDHPSLLAGRPQAVATNPEGAFQLFRIGDAVSSRNTHAAIYDALRLVRTL
jgi:pyruvate/2-oxoglutarate dehydrogenase complex dihydrolipoamide dehydrogenase (E3) component